MSAVRTGLARILFAGLVMLPGAGFAQAPFDMSGERGEVPAGSGNGGGVIVPSGPPPASGGAGDPDGGSRKAPTPPPAGERYATGERLIDRFIVAAPTLRFEGEMGQRSWGVALTGEQARRVASLSISYNSSIYVAPESSYLRVTVNDRVVLQEPLIAHEATSRMTVPFPSGILRAGTNIVTFTVVQRHRTDCTIESTYDLWTDIDGAGTGLVYEDPDVSGFASLDDLPAVGFDAEGATRLRLILPGGDRRLADAGLLDLLQAIVIQGDFRHPQVEIVTEAEAAASPGTLHIAVGTAKELANVPGLPGEAADAPSVAFAGGSGRGPILVLTGPDRSDVTAAIAYIVDRAERPGNTAPSIINTTPWLLPPVPVLSGKRQLTFAELGAQATEFSGRRYHSEFYVGLPGDFYSDAYGQASLLLDAAYTGDVKPGSHIDVYVNGFIAANTPLTSESGDIFRHLPIKVALTHFRPGINRIVVEAVLETEADAICAPGAAGDGPNRFVVFDTSEFRMPDFGRMGRWPNLSALTGTGAPYARSDVPLQVVLGRSDGQVFAAAATAVTRLAVSAGRLLRTELARPDAISGKPALLVGTIEQFSAQTLTDLGIDNAALNDWKQRPKPVFADLPVEVDPGAVVPSTFGEGPSTTGLYDQWRREIVNPTGLRGTWQSFETWLERTFDLSIASLWQGSAAGPFNPPNRATLMIAQTPADDDQIWTLIAAPTVADLTAGVAEITSRRFWPTIAGRVAVFDDASGTTSFPADSQRFMLDSTLSLQNVRLVAANWLSVNIVPYALALVVLCAVLGVCTSALLSRLGRRS